MTDTLLRTEAVRVPESTLVTEARAAAVVWQREMIRFGKDRTRIVSSLAQPLLFLFVLGSGLGSLLGSGGGPVSLKTFLFPGVLAISVLFTAGFAGISIVWDREFGFLREMLVAPVSSASILVGKATGGATVATVQSVLVLALAGLVGVPYSVPMFLGLLVLVFLMAFMITTLGLVLAARVRQVQSAMPLVQLIITPMMFLSGALFPIANLPTWLTVLVHVNPMTYAVEPMRSLVFDHIAGVDAATRARFDPGIHWGSVALGVPTQIGITLLITVLLLGLAVLRFRRTE